MRPITLLLPALLLIACGSHKYVASSHPNGKPEGRTRKANKASDKFIVRRRKTGKKR